MNQKSEIRNQKSRSAGFTIAEMLIVTIIIGVLTTAGARSYLTERDRVEFNNALIKIVEMIKTARNMATTSTSHYIEPSGPTVIPVDGYGIFMDMEPAEGEPHLTVFANINPQSPNSSDDQPDNYDSVGLTADQVIETYRFPKQIELNSFFFDEAPGNGTLVKQWDDDEETPGPIGTRQAVIIFKPPLAETVLTDNGNPAKILDELGVKFINLTAEPGAPKGCPLLRINRIRTFTEIDYSNTADPCELNP